MKLALRRAAFGASAIIAAAAFAAPAFAAETTADLSVTLSGTTWTAGTEAKPVQFTVTNKGPQKATTITYDIDVSGIDATKIDYSMPAGVGCSTVDANKVFKDCVLGNHDLEVGESREWGIYNLAPIGSWTGSAGTIKVTVKSAQDENTADNTVSGEIVVKKQDGVDLLVFAYDIAKATETDPGYETPVTPGTTSYFWAGAFNFGTVTTTAIKVDIKLPTGVTFVGSEPDCNYTTGSTSTVCTYAQEAAQAEPGSGTRFFFQVKVGADVAGPARVPGGVITMTDVPATPELRSKSTKSTKTFLRTSVSDIKDLDPTDNTANFVAFVGAKASGTGGGLPVTGAKVGMVAGIGGAAVALGAALFFVSRRRRVNA